MKRECGPIFVGFGFIFVLAGVLVLGFSGHFKFNGQPMVVEAIYIGQLVAVTLILAGFSVSVTGQIGGFALSGQNTYSLSRLQMAGWTVLVIATLFTAAEVRIFGFFGAVPQPLDIGIPGELLEAMGIAVFTTAATPALLALKTTGSPTDGQSSVAAQRMATQSGTDTSKVDNVGSLMMRTNAADARWSDLIAGEEVGNAGTIDLSKVQQLLITLLLLGTYVGMVIDLIWSYGSIATTTAATATEIAKSASYPFVELPPLSQDFIGLMAISHAGYLGYKAIPKPASDVSTQPAGVQLPIAPQAAPPPQ